MARLEARGVGLARGGRWLVRSVDVTVSAGEFWVLLGPNGAGKSTLLRILSGELAADEGQVLLDGSVLARMDGLDLARRRSMLSQRRDAVASAFPFTVREVVSLGRHPYARRETAEEAGRATERALRRTRALHLAERLYATLSGGEAARVDLARALAQDTEILFVDEPTNHLDPAHQVEVTRLCRELAREGRAVVAALHDLDLAAAFADRLLVLKEGLPVASGHPAEVLTPPLLEEVFGIVFEVVPGRNGRPRVFPALTEPEERVPRLQSLQS